jgi:hypothetical protein
MGNNISYIKVNETINHGDEHNRLREIELKK